MTKIPCSRCGGSGRMPYTHVQGGVCFLCKGTGGKTVTLAEGDAAARRRAKAKAKRAEKLAAERARQAVAAAEWDRRIEHYRNDARLGPRTRARYDRYPQVAFEVASTLAKWDADPSWIKAKPWIADNLSE